MSSRFEELTAGYSGLSPDYAEEMELPSLARQREGQRQREQEEELHTEQHEVAESVVEAEREATGERGGSGGNADQQTAGAGGASAPEAMPQRDEPDEGEHARSAPEEEVPVEVEAEQSAEEDGQGAEAQEPEPVAPEPEVDQDELDEPVPTLPTVTVPVQQMPEGAQPLEWSQAEASKGFSFDGEAVQLRKLPQQLIDVLRGQLMPFGAEFAQKISAPALVTAFICARLGVALPGSDGHTEQAVRAFAALSPELASLEHRVDSVDDALQQVVQVLTGLRKEVEVVGGVARVVEMSNAYLVTDRYEQIAPPGTTGATVQLRHPKALETRRSLAKQVSAQVGRDKVAEGRPIR